VNAAAECEMILVGSSNVEPIRLWEALRVSIGGVEQTGHRVSCRNLRPVNFGVEEGDANGSRNGGIVPEALLDCARNQGRRGYQQVPLVAML